MKGLRLSHLLLFIAIAATVALHPAAPAAGQVKPAPGTKGDQPAAPSSSVDAHAISLEIEAMRSARVLSGGNTQMLASAEEAARRHPINVKPVVFDTARARRLGFSHTSIAVGQQLAAASNEIIANAARAQWRRTPATGTALKLDLVKYPALRQFFEALDRRGSASPSLNSSLRPNFGGQVLCGSYDRPKPSRAADWVRFEDVSDPEAIVRSWGYHETPDWAGGGWTRPHHYHRLFCGWNAFRDHVKIESPTIIAEQNYDGWSPRGEPNPEVWTVHPWAYPDWPAYVYWWHQNH